VRVAASCCSILKSQCILGHCFVLDIVLCVLQHRVAAFYIALQHSQKSVVLDKQSTSRMISYLTNVNRFSKVSALAYLLHGDVTMQSTFEKQLPVCCVGVRVAVERRKMGAKRGLIHSQKRPTIWRNSCLCDMLACVLQLSVLAVAVCLEVVPEKEQHRVCIPIQEKGRGGNILTLRSVSELYPKTSILLK
jgi:hypothetical protein